MMTSFRLLSTAAASALLCFASSMAGAQTKVLIKLAHSDAVDLTTVWRAPR